MTFVQASMPRADENGDESVHFLARGVLHGSLAPLKQVQRGKVSVRPKAKARTVRPKTT